MVFNVITRFLLPNPTNPPQLQGGENGGAIEPQAPPRRRDQFLALTNLMGQARAFTNQAVQVITDPRAQALLRVGTQNPDLGRLLVRLGTSSNVDINSLKEEELLLIINNLDLLQETRFLSAVKNDINDPRFKAFLKLREKDKNVADSLARLFARAITKPNFGINDITNDELLLIANNLELMEETGFLNTIRSDLPSEVHRVLEFRENNPNTFGAARWLGNTFPFLIDFGRDVAERPWRGYFTGATSAAGAIGFGILCFSKLSLLCAVPALLPAVAIGALIGFGVGALLSCKPVTNFLSNVASGIGNALSALKFW